jgi:hypothetical protein
MCAARVEFNFNFQAQTKKSLQKAVFSIVHDQAKKPSFKPYFVFCLKSRFEFRSSPEFNFNACQFLFNSI